MRVLLGACILQRNDQKGAEIVSIQGVYDSSDVYELFTNVAKRLHFSRYELREMCKRGEFPEPIRFGKRRLVFRRAEVEAWIRQREKRDWREYGAVGESLSACTKKRAG